MLGGIDAEAGHADVNEVVQVLRDPGAHVVLPQRQVQQADQAAVPHLGGILKHSSPNKLSVVFYTHFECSLPIVQCQIKPSVAFVPQAQLSFGKSSTKKLQ